MRKQLIAEGSALMSESNLQGGQEQVPDTDPAAAKDRPHSDDDDCGGEAGRDILW